MVQCFAERYHTGNAKHLSTNASDWLQGTLVVAGRARGIVVGTGGNTAIGKIRWVLILMVSMGLVLTQTRRYVLQGRYLLSEGVTSTALPPAGMLGGSAVIGRIQKVTSAQRMDT